MGYYDEYLEHHGILGQKWGVRRFENAAGRLTAAGKSRYNQINGEYQKLKKKVMPSKVESTGEKKKEGTDNEEEKKKGLTDKQKKMIIAGAAIAGTALAAYGGYKLYQHVENTKKEARDRIIKSGNEATMKALQSEHAKEMRAIGDYNAAVSNNLRNPQTGGSMFLNRKHADDYKDHWVGVSQRNKAEINKRNAEIQENAKKIGSSYKASKAYLNAEKRAAKEGRERDLIDIQSATRSISRIAKPKDSGNKLKSQKAVESVQEKYKKDLAQWRKGSMKTPPPLPPTHSKAGKAATDKLAAEASALAKTVTSQGPKSFSKPAQNGASSRKQEQDRVRTIEQNLLKARQESLRRTQSASNVVKFNGSQKFSQAAKANDDYVSQMLKKNASNLSQYTMKDLRDLDLY